MLLKRDPITTSPYVLLSNLYASDGTSNCVAKARKMLKGSRLKKELGHSLIEVKGVVEKFTIGDFSHARIEHIVHILKTLGWEGNEVLSVKSSKRKSISWHNVKSSGLQEYECNNNGFLLIMLKLFNGFRTCIRSYNMDKGS
ncbi:Pentatricopeptide repeat-containing protein [Camellia lanceoleosa]|uniref:Pentatricopeptide repeat-containing protein n=1 Tax=Camellia lanceoleosa TaxID=1840588 RepID=A0ACC0FKG9_9ERIC|nr:Pentatricopeptide repeat-containing protein [Camellia lanceoleosa]